MFAMLEQPRVLAVVRLSVSKDDTTSPEKQREAVEHWTYGPVVNGRVIGYAEDLDVSGGMHPFKRPGLGPWLTERADDFDVIAVWKLDRLTRRSAHFSEVYEWCQKRGKIIVSVTEGVDMSTPMGKMFAQIIAAFAEGELDTIRARALSGSRARLSKGVWVGGVLPFGYRFQRQEGGGKKLIQDPEYSKLLLDIIDKLNGGWSSYKIAIDLNRRGVLTWRDHLRVQQGNPARGVEWTSNAVLVAVKNPTVGGVYTYKGQIVEDEDGEPVPITNEPIMPYSEWSKLVARLSSRKKAIRAAPSRSLLGGVAVCEACGGRMSSSKRVKSSGRVYYYYVCNAMNTGKCSRPGRVRRDDADPAVNTFVEIALGDLPVVERASNAISETKSEMAHAKARLERLETDFLAGKYDAEGQEESYWRMHKALTARVSKVHEELERASVAPRFVDTGRTYRQMWSGMDDEQRRVFVQRHEINIRIGVDSEDSAIRVIKVSMPGMREVVEAAGPWLPKHLARIEMPTLEYRINARRKRGQGSEGQVDWDTTASVPFRPAG
ncbi:recombinase family protein [Streptomyces sp. AP-93]|uniref:recombinase family protein n=1 Tax=Streptomyces sp. AP-93 TaxID=2929048 RepID=UPI001FAFCB27|nr:recombinase family protein [Streptomyces sp. AP-93]MCJ0871253.1 recombinase family protein [Streptomyces sp. AP-93]